MTVDEILLLVDDAPETQGALITELEAEGYTVLVAHDGQAALDRLEWVIPDGVLMDAAMPGIDGFEACRRLKANPTTAHIPVIFMTGLSDTDHVVKGFDAGGVDYVVKPVIAQEVKARLSRHVRNARAARVARDALDVGGNGVVVVDARGRVAWRSPKARRWLAEFFHEGDDEMTRWLAAPGAHLNGVVQRPGREGILTARHLGDIGWGESMWILSVHATSAPSHSRQLATLTQREAEVLSWIAKGKTNRDVGEILGMSPRTVNKHLERVYEKLGVETRTAAVAMATRRESY